MLAIIGPDDAQWAWGLVTTIANYLPLDDLAKVSDRLGRGEAQIDKDADHAFTWGVYHHWVEACSAEGIDAATVQIDDGFQPPFAQPERLVAYDALAVALDRHPAASDVPDRWRQSCLFADVCE